MTKHGPIEGAVHAMMNGVARVMDDLLPKDYGFALMVFRINTSEGRMNYISNVERADMITAMKELIANFEGRAHDAPSSQQ